MVMAAPVSAQFFLGDPVAIDIRPVWTRGTVELRDSQWSATRTNTRWEFNAWGEVADRVRLRYSFMPGFTISDVVIPAGTFYIGSTDFGPQQQGGGGGGQQQTQQPVSLDFKNNAENRVEISGPVWWPLCPLVMAEWVQCEVTATGKKNGQTITDGESFSRGWIGFGGLFQYRTPRSVVNVVAAGGSGFGRLEGTLFYRYRPDFAVNCGYFFESKTLQQAKIKRGGPFIGAVLEF